MHVLTYFLKCLRTRSQCIARGQATMTIRLTCSRYCDRERKTWKNCWHPPATCIGRDSTRHTRSAAAGLKIHASFRKLPPAVSRIIFLFVNWVNIYPPNKALLDAPPYFGPIRGPNRTPSSRELVRKFVLSGTTATMGREHVNPTDISQDLF